MEKKQRTLVLLVFIVFVSLGFWLISRYPALDSKAAMSGMEAFEDQLSHQPHFQPSENASSYERVFISTLNWYETNWRGMAFGLVLAGGFLTLLSYLPKKSSKHRLKNSLMGMLVGTPLGVCVNCVAPIAKGIYEAGSKMETALAVMFSSPTLNIVILTMVFTIFPFYMALLKVGATLVLVLLIVPLISKKDLNIKKETLKEAPSTIQCDILPSKESWVESVIGSFKDYFQNFKYIVIRTVPFMLLAGFLGALASHVWSFEKFIGMPVTWKTLGLISFLGTFLPLPIAFDVMLAQALKVSGLAEGFIMTLLFTLGTFSVYSALVVYRTFSLKIALQLYLIVALLGMGLGYVANVYSDYQFVQWLKTYETFVEHSGNKLDSTKKIKQKIANPKTQIIKNFPTTPIKRKLLFEGNEISIEYFSHNERNVNESEPPFTKILGPELGIEYFNKLSSVNFFDPFFFGRGISSGDITGDGWVDIAIATDKGIEVYQNINGQKFQKLEISQDTFSENEAINVALVDMNNDGALDIFSTTFNNGNFLWVQSSNQQPLPKRIIVPNNSALLTNSVSFGDIDGNGFLDIVNGNYFLGVLTRTPLKQSQNQIVLNKRLQFELKNLPGIPGQTQTSLLSDINFDSKLDLLIGNDYRVADTYYWGQGEGVLKKILKQDSIIPITTENTMSMDTGDIDNDLIPDIYLANIGFSRGIDVVSNIFGQGMKEVGRNFCNSRVSVMKPDLCHNLIKLVTLLNPEKQDTSERCDQLGSREKVGNCMATRMALLAIKKDKPNLCEKLVKSHPLSQTLCRKYFDAEFIKFDRKEEIPIRSLTNILLKGKGNNAWEDISENTNAQTAEWSWNAKFADLDNDEWQDLYVVNGVLITQEFASNNFFHNQKGVSFKPSQKEFGLEDLDHSSSYTYLDFDNDGDLDIIANTLYGPFKIYRNNETKGNSITFDLKQEVGNRFCIGCRIIIRYGPEWKRNQFREVKASGGFRSFDGSRVHFGLGAFESVQEVEIHWSDGAVTKFSHPLLANQNYIISRKNSQNLENFRN